MTIQWQPKKTKFKRVHKGSIRNCEFRQSAINLQQGSFGLRVLKSGRLTSKQLEAARRKVAKETRKKEKLWLRSIPDIPVTAKPQAIRMGKGKGNVSFWVSRLTAGKVIFQISWMNPSRAKRILTSAAKMLPVPTKFWTNKVNDGKTT